MLENKRIDKIMASLQNMERPEANSYLLTRILAKANEENSGVLNFLTGFLQRPAIAISLVLIVLAINSFFLYNNSKTSFDLSNSTVSNSKSDFDSDLNSIYDIENGEQ